MLSWVFRYPKIAIFAYSLQSCITTLASCFTIFRFFLFFGFGQLDPAALASAVTRMAGVNLERKYIKVMFYTFETILSCFEQKIFFRFRKFFYVPAEKKISVEKKFQKKNSKKKFLLYVLEDSELI